MNTEKKEILKEYFNAIGLNDLPKEERGRTIKACVGWVTSPSFDNCIVALPMIGNTIEQRSVTLPVKPKTCLLIHTV